MNTNKKTPKLRFKGFADDWEQRKLGNLYKRVNERNDGSLGRDKWISVAKMYFQDPDKVQSNNLDTRTYVMKKGDIAFEGHPNNEFKFGRFVLNDIGTGIISELFPIYRPITEYDLDFWKYAIQLERVMAPIFAKSITSSGNSSNKLDHNHFLNQELMVPNIEEQKKIGTLLSKLSKNIALHQRKLEKLKLNKNALLQKLFPQNGCTIPEIRFKGFTDAWEQRKLIYIFNDFIVPMRDKPKVFSGTTPWTRIEDIEGRYINTSLSGQFVSDETIKSMNLKVIPKGSLIVSASATFGVVAIVNNDLITNQTFIGLVPNKDFDIDFLYSLFEAPTTKGKLLKLSAGSTIFYIARESFENLVLSVPSKEEQIKISKVFKSIDDSITLHQRKLDCLISIKKALLQQLFV